MKHRMQALDWMRGIVMVIMVTDHASEAFNAARPVTDSVLLPGWDQPLDALQFPFRWLSHICAPVFLFLAGTSMALSIGRKLARGTSGWSIDKDLLIRGLLILGVDLFLINLVWHPGALLLQVMYAIGLSMICMIGLRRLPDGLLIAFAFGALIVGEWTRSGLMPVPAGWLPGGNAALLNAGMLPVSVFHLNGILVAYPVLPWCAMMAMGWVLGRYLLRRAEADGGSVDGAAVVKPLALVGVVLLLGFVLLRGLNGFGNLGLLRTDGSLLQWLHVSKYPPSLSYAALELGIMFVILAGLFRMDAARGRISGPNHPVLVFGQTAFFFYLAHIFLLELGARASGIHMQGGLGHALLGFGIVIVVLYPLCLGYRRVKARHPGSFLRYF